MVRKIPVIVFMLILLAIQFLSAAGETYVIANSENWKDVYSSMLYASLEDIGSDFLTSASYAPTLLNGIKKDNTLLVVSSDESPYVYNYLDIINSENFEGANEITVEDGNLELIDELPNIRNFVIVGDSYGYNAIAVTPYAVQKNSWVFLANRINIQEIDSILSTRNIDELLIYGYVDREVRDTLDKYNPRTIDTKDRFKDNIEIVEEYLDLNPTKQVLLTNGEFLEKQLMIGTEPTLFTGKENVPDQIRDYLKNSPIEIGILIGNDLIGTATNIRESTGISVMVKFARGARSQTSGVAAVEGLDLFPVPIPLVKLSIYSIRYNRVSSQLEITYKSESNIPLYLKGTITIGGSRVGDAQTVFVAPENYRTVTYQLDDLPEDTKAEIFTIYGESASALDRILEATLDIETIDVLDNCQIDLEWIKYNKQKGEFRVKVKNIASVECWVNLELSDLKVGYEELTIGTETPEKIGAKKSKIIHIAQEMTDSDLEKNGFISITAHYGEREDSLVKTLTKTLELKTELFGVMTYIIIAIVIIILVLLIIIFILKRRDDDDESY